MRLDNKLFTSIYYQILSFLNHYTISYLVVLFFIINKTQTVSEIFLILSFSLIITHGFSANLRNIYLGTKNYLYFKKIILIRLIIAVPGFILTNFFVIFFIEEKFLILNHCIIFLIFFNWIQELLIARLEKIEKIKFIQALNQGTIYLVTPILIYYDKSLIYLCLLIIFNVLINIFIFRTILKKSILVIHNFSFHIFKDLRLNIGFFSTLLKTFVNFYWRFLIIFFIGKITASFLFIGFMLGSFFGTLFDISYGSYFFKKIKNKNLFVNFFFIIYIFIILLFLYLIKTYSDYSEEQIKLLFIVTIFSIIGSYLMVSALRIRQLLFEKKYFLKICYKHDILIQIMNFLIIPILWSIDKDYLVASYFFSSLFFYLIYKGLEDNVDKK